VAIIAVPQDYRPRTAVLYDITQTTPCSGILLSGSKKLVKWGRIEIKYHREEWQKIYQFLNDFCILAIMNIQSKIFFLHFLSLL